MCAQQQVQSVVPLIGCVIQSGVPIASIIGDLFFCPEEEEVVLAQRVDGTANQMSDPGDLSAPVSCRASSRLCQ